jgi:hypothetical protein
MVGKKHRSCDRLNFTAILLLLFSMSSLYGQFSIPGRPYPLTYEGSPELIVYNIPVTDELRSQSLIRTDSDLLKPAKSGILIDLNFNTGNSGVWDTLKNGVRLWRSAFHVNDAFTLDLILSPFNLNKGVKVFIYDKNQQFVTGAFSDFNNKPLNLLATSQIPGDLLIIEVQVPVYVDSEGSFGISGIGCDFYATDQLKATKDGWYGASGACNVDVNCSNDEMVRLVKNSVVRIVFSGTERCTGTLMNTTGDNSINYVLTAGHCFENEAAANTAVFYFNYESPSCNGPDGKSSKSLSGATIRAASENLDFALVELFEPVPFTYHPYYAGWDHSGQSVSSATAIHHPLGDVKKMSIEEHTLSVTSFGSGYDASTHWLVRHWELGTTEAGSSGGPLFNSSGHLVGTLTGGMAKCGNSIKDYFQMFSHSWKDYPDQHNQLANWLDPLNLKTQTWDGVDPYRDFWATGDTLSNIYSTEIRTVEKGNLLWGSYSGHNSDLLTGFAEHYSLSGNKKMLGIFLDVANNYTASDSSGFMVKVWNSLDNTALYEKQVLFADLVANTGNFIEFDKPLEVAGDFYTGYELNYLSPQDTFATYMAATRPAGSVNTAWVNDGIHWQLLSAYTNNEINSSFAIFPVVFDSIPGGTITELSETVSAYPNPAKNNIRLVFRDVSSESVHISMYNMQGGTIINKEYGPFQHIIPLELTGFAGGIYLIRVKQGNHVSNIKVAIVK